MFPAFDHYLLIKTLIFSWFCLIDFHRCNIYNFLSSNFATGNRVTGWLTFILHRMEVMLMKKFDFRDLMSFGMFLLALLTFIYLICH